MLNTNLTLNIYEKKEKKSKLSSQLLYGEQFKVIRKYKKWLKIKSKYDGYVGYIHKKKFRDDVSPTHKISILKANLYSRPKTNYKLKKKISFCSLIKVSKNENKFFKFDQYWIKKKDVVNIKKKYPINSKIKIFENVKYKWGGGSYNGIDCSALVQIFYKFNNIFCPRDSGDQNKFFKKKGSLKFLKKNDIIFWRGHVAICLSKKKLIHAYGPRKKVLIMNSKKTIEEIRTKSKLMVLSVKRNENNRI